MKTVFIEARHDDKIVLPDVAISKLPQNIGVFTTIQFINCLSDICVQIKSAGKNPILFKAKHAEHEGQILGCSIDKFDADSFLFIGDGMFHPTALAIKNNKPVYIYNPFSKQFFELDLEIIEKYNKKTQGAYAKFLSSENIGILVSTKPGQNRLNDAEKLKNSQDKNCYILIQNDIDFQGLENFPFIDCFVNTACPRIGYDDQLPKPVVDIELIYEMEE